MDFDYLKKLTIAPGFEDILSQVRSPLEGIKIDTEHVSHSILNNQVPDPMLRFPRKAFGDLPLSFDVVNRGILEGASTLTRIGDDVASLAEKIDVISNLSTDEIWETSGTLLPDWIAALDNIDQMALSPTLDLYSSISVGSILGSISNVSWLPLRIDDYVAIEETDEEVDVSIHTEKLLEDRAQGVSLARRRIERALRKLVAKTLQDFPDWWHSHCPGNAKDRLHKLGLDPSKMRESEFLDSLNFDELKGLIASKKLYPKYFEPFFGEKSEFLTMSTYFRDGRNIETHSKDLMGFDYVKFAFAAIWFCSILGLDETMMMNVELVDK